MDRLNDYLNEMPDLLLDAGTVDRILAGVVSPEDAPPELAEVTRLLGEARRQVASLDGDLEVATVSAMAAALRWNGGRRVGRWTRAGVAAASFAGALALSGGLAAANVLPNAAQSVASTMLAKVGVTVPNRGAPLPTVEPSERDTENTTAGGEGPAVSDLATTTAATGVEKGAAISAVASSGESKAGEHHPGPASPNAQRSTLPAPAADHASTIPSTQPARDHGSSKAGTRP